MIKLNPNPTFKAPVKITVPGQEEPVEISMTFRHMAVDRANEWFEANKGRTSSAAMAEIVLDWDGVADESDQPVPFSAEQLDIFLKNYRAATGEIVAAWMREMTASRLKN